MYKLQGYVIPRWTILESSDNFSIYPYGKTIDDYRSLLSEILKMSAADPHFTNTNIIVELLLNRQT